MSREKQKLSVQGSQVTVLQENGKDYISLTDMVRDIENGLALIEKWLRNKNTIEFLGIWEEIYNPDFNSPEFEGIKNQAGLNRFVLSVKQWVEKTGSIGIIAKAGRYGGTYAYKDIAFEFASWISPQFKLYLIKEFQRLKEHELQLLGWDIRRNLTKINYRIADPACGSGGAFKTLRQLLVERCDLKAVITMPSGVFKPYAGVSTTILLFTKVWGPKDKITKPATEHVWFYEMQADGYSLDDKRSKQEGCGDLQDIVARFHARNPETDTNRTAKCFVVSRASIETEGYDLSLSRYKEDVFEEVAYEAPGMILERLLVAELGEEFYNREIREKRETVLGGAAGGIVRELLELREMVG